MAYLHFLNMEKCNSPLKEKVFNAYVCQHNNLLKLNLKIVLLKDSFACDYPYTFHNTPQYGPDTIQIRASLST